MNQYISQYTAYTRKSAHTSVHYHSTTQHTPQQNTPACNRSVTMAVAVRASDIEYVDSYVDRVLETLTQRDPDQPEFFQAVKEVCVISMSCH